MGACRHSNSPKTLGRHLSAGLHLQEDGQVHKYRHAKQRLPASHLQNSYSTYTHRLLGYATHQNVCMLLYINHPYIDITTVLSDTYYIF